MTKLVKTRNALVLEPSKKTPKVILDPDNNIFEISGKSLPENAEDFYTPLFSWLDDYVENPNQHTRMVVKLYYMNTSSSKAVYRFIVKLKEINDFESKVSVCWMYDDEDMEECGRDFERVTKLKFDYQEYHEVG